MHMQASPTSRLTHIVAWIACFMLVATLALVSPASVANAESNVSATDITTTTEDYVTTFYPIWFTHSQFSVAPHNRLIGPAKISPIYQGVVAINDDTLYASTPVDVSGGPVIVSVPQTPAGYSVLLLDPYGNVYPPPVPSKPAGDMTPTTVYGLVDPNYSGSVPNTDVTVKLPLKFMTLIFRVDKFSNGVDETSEASDFRTALSMNGLPTNVLPEYYFALPFKTAADTLISVAPIAFLRQTQRAVADTSTTPPLSTDEQQLSDHFNALFGDGSNLTLVQRLQFAAGARSAHDAILSNYIDHRDANNWTHFTNIGQWGNAVLDRASITEFCQYCNTIETAAYYHAFLDGNGAPLNGSTPGGYVMTFPNGGTPATTRFWSLTAYTPNAVELIPNPINKYVVASYTPGLVTNNDGSITIYISQTKPVGVPQANWLPVSNRPFNVMLRDYGVVPGSDVANNTYLPPAIVQP